MSSPILVVDDDLAVLRGVGALLEQSGYSVQYANCGARAIDLLDCAPLPALVVLDVLMPVCDGFEVCAYLRQLPAHIPILMLSARDEIADKVHGLEIGADDYLTKPFAPRELLARVRALLRFKQRVIGCDDDEPQLVFGSITMWPARHHVEVNGQVVDLAPKEWALLELFLTHPDKVFGRETLLRQIWGYDFAGDSRTVDVHIQRLRAKLEDDAAASRIQTIRGFGYRFTASAAALPPAQ